MQKKIKKYICEKYPKMSQNKHLENKNKKFAIAMN